MKVLGLRTCKNNHKGKKAGEYSLKLELSSLIKQPTNNRFLWKCFCSSQQLCHQTFPGTSAGAPAGYLHSFRPHKSPKSSFHTGGEQNQVTSYNECSLFRNTNWKGGLEPNCGPSASRARTLWDDFPRSFRDPYYMLMCLLMFFYPTYFKVPQKMNQIWNLWKCTPWCKWKQGKNKDILERPSQKNITYLW